MAVEVIVAAILRSGDRVLLCHRRPDRRWYPDVWDLPGGHVEPGETPTDALQRELGEELGIEARVSPGDEPVVLVEDGVEFQLWTMSEWVGEVTNAAPNEHDSIGWFTRSGIAEIPLASDRYLDLLFPDDPSPRRANSIV